MDINGVYWGYNPVILTFDPNFQRDILVEGHQSFFVHWPHGTALSMMNCPAPGWTASCPRGPPVLSRMYSYVFRQGLFFFWCSQVISTPPKFNMEPENNGFQMDFPFPGTYFQVPY